MSTGLNGVKLLSQTISSSTQCMFAAGAATVAAFSLPTMPSRLSCDSSQELSQQPLSEVRQLIITCPSPLLPRPPSFPLVFPLSLWSQLVWYHNMNCYDDDDDDEGRINLSVALSPKTARTRNNKPKQWSHVNSSQCNETLLVMTVRPGKKSIWIFYHDIIPSKQYYRPSLFRYCDSNKLQC